MKHPRELIPTKSGVYLFKDEHGKVLYVGKAKNLKSRVGSYFSSKLADRPWTAVMVGLAADIETIVVNSELEALMLEAVLIKKYMPRFNILLTDDKSYPLIKLTVNEEFPRLQVVRKQIDDGARYFGPFLSAWSATKTCEFLRKLYGVHIANNQITGRLRRGCLNCQIEDNLCPLAGEISPEQYRIGVDRVIDFLQGKRNALIKDVEAKMRLASANQRYETAGKLRDTMRALTHTTDKQDIISTSLENYDAVGVARSGEQAIAGIVRVRDGRLSSQHFHDFTVNSDQSNSNLIRQYLISIYLNELNLPPLLVLPEKISDQLLIEKWLKGIRNGAFELRIAQRGEKLSISSLAQKNAQARLETKLLKSGRAIGSLIALKELLRLAELPYLIEAVDISNLGASETVGATVCFVNGTPDKNEYRRYKIKTVGGQNDFAMITEVTKRRFSDASRMAPDLFVVDGGPEQLKAAIRGLKDTPRQPNRIISLAKKPDRVFVPERKLPIIIKRGDKGLLLLSKIRDEAHRFVIGYHRRRQRNKSLLA